MPGPRQSLPPDVLSVSDRDPDNEEHEAQEGHLLSSPAETDAAMAEEATQEVVSVHSSPSESPTIPSTEQPEDDDAHMEDNDSASSSSTEAGDCLSNRPVLPDACPAQDDMLAAGDDARSALLPQNVDHPSDSPRSHSSESPIKRRPGPKAHTGRVQPKKSRKSLASTSRQPLGSVSEHEQPPATLDDPASRNAQRQEAPVCRNPETPPSCPGSAQERPQAMTEIDIASDQEQAERGGTAALISSWNPNREPCRSCTTIKRQKPPEKLTGKRCRSPQYRSTVTCLENGRWRGLLSPTSKSTVLSAHSSGGE